MNHTEAAMALAVGGRIDEAVRAFDWLAGRQRARRRLAPLLRGRRGGGGQVRRQLLRLPATGLWCPYTLTGDRRLLDRFWPMIDRALEFVLGPGVDRAWRAGACHGGRAHRGRSRCSPATPPSATACAGGCAWAAVVGEACPRWESGSRRLLQVIAHHPEAFAP
ncbi:MAG: hypothetical protein R2755_04240 [Acidimicrobiales bacterium]